MVSGDGGGDRGQDEGGEQGCSLSETKTFRLSLEMQSFPRQCPLPLSLGALDNFSLSRAAFCSCNTTSQRLSQADLDGKERPYYSIQAGLDESGEEELPFNRKKLPTE